MPFVTFVKVTLTEEALTPSRSNTCRSAVSLSVNVFFVPPNSTSISAARLLPLKKLSVSPQPVVMPKRRSVLLPPRSPSLR